MLSKTEEFSKCLLVKFPELNETDITNLRQAIAGEVNADKEAVISNSDLLKQLQDSNNQLKAENTSLKNQLNQVQSLVTVVQA